MRHTTRLLTALAGAAALLAAALPADAQSARERARERERERERERAEYEWQRGEGFARLDTVLSVGDAPTVDLGLLSGTIRVTPGPRGQVRINARSDRGQLRLDATSSRVQLKTVGTRSGEATYEVQAPPGARVTASATSGDIGIRGIGGPVEVNSMSGNVSIEDARDRVSLSVLSGDAQVRRVAGDLRANIVSGDLTAEEVQGEVEVITVSGDVGLRDVRSRYVVAKSTSGDIRYDGTVDTQGRYEFISHSGDVTLYLPETLGATLEVETFSGEIESDYQMTLGPGQTSGRRMRLTVGDGAARIGASTFSGDIALRRGRPR